MNSLENWIRWHGLDERQVVNIISENCIHFSDNNINACDASEDSCQKCVSWLEGNKHLIGLNFFEQSPNVLV
jgi:hypothetical protein